MGRTSYSMCEDCKVFQYNGYGSYTTSMDHFLSLAEYDADCDDWKHLQKNKNHRAFLVEHAGHGVSFTSPDDWYSDDDRKQFEGMTNLPAMGWVDPD